MRSLLCRAKHVDTSEWVYGYYYQYVQDDTSRHYILDPLNESWVPKNHPEIDIQTFGQFTSFTALDGHPIYEGDILSSGSKIISPSIVLWDESKSGFYIHGFSYSSDSIFEQVFNRYWAKTHDVIGNKYDNKDLLDDRLR